MHQKSELSQTQSNSKKSYDLNASDPSMVEEEVTQSQFAEREGFGKGMCGGLSTFHILAQLKSKYPEIKNPFWEAAIVEYALNLQQRCASKTDCFLEYLADEFPEDKRRRINQLANSNQAGEFLEKKIQQSLKDEKSRGIYLITDVNRHPIEGTPVSGGHAFSMTIQQQDKKLYCTGMDSNFFFAKGYGVNGCHKIAERLKQSLDDYGGKTIVAYTVKQPLSE